MAREGARRRARADRLGDALEATRHARRPRRACTARSSICFRSRADMRRFAGERLERLGARADARRSTRISAPSRIAPITSPGIACSRTRSCATASPPRRSPRSSPASISSIRNDRYAGGDRVLADDAGMIGAAYARRTAGKRADDHRPSSPSATSSSRPSRRRASSCTGRPTRTTSTSTSRTRTAATRGTRSKHAARRAAISTPTSRPATARSASRSRASRRRARTSSRSTTTRRARWATAWACSRSRRFDGKGGLTFEDRPYVIMVDHAFVDLGTYK